MATYEQISHFQRLKNNMKGMTFKEKIAHLWDYYKWFVIVGVILIISAVSVVFSVVQNSKELVYGGVITNLSVTEEGKTYLKEGWFEALDSNPKKQKIELDEIYVPNMDQPSFTETSRVNAAKVTTMITAGYVDYVMADAYSIHYLASAGSFQPLDAVLSEELMDQFEGKLVTYKDDDTTYLVAVDISELPFVKKNVATPDKVYIAFPGNTGRTERNAAFLEYLMNWSE